MQLGCRQFRSLVGSGGGDGRNQRTYPSPIRPIGSGPRYPWDQWRSPTAGQTAVPRRSSWDFRQQRELQCIALRVSVARRASLAQRRADGSPSPPRGPHVSGTATDPPALDHPGLACGPSQQYANEPVSGHCKAVFPSGVRLRVVIVRCSGPLCGSAGRASLLPEQRHRSTGSGLWLASHSWRRGAATSQPQDPATSTGRSHRIACRSIGLPGERAAMFTTRPEIAGTFGVVASTHWLASQVGMAVLERGGNAFDAAVRRGLHPAGGGAASERPGRRRADHPARRAGRHAACGLRPGRLPAGRHAGSNSERSASI